MHFGKISDFGPHNFGAIRGMDLFVCSADLGAIYGADLFVYSFTFLVLCMGFFVCGAEPLRRLVLRFCFCRLVSHRRLHHPHLHLGFYLCLYPLYPHREDFHCRRM